MYDGAQMIQQVVNPSGATTRRYVWGAAPGELLAWYEGSGTADRRYAHADERGSIVGYTDASGTAIIINHYDEYGIPESTNNGQFQYTGQMWLPELGLYDYKARMYSATLGRFLQTDPIGYGDGTNWYNYVGSNPVNGSDPSGLEKKEMQKPQLSSNDTAPSTAEIVVTANRDPPRERPDISIVLGSLSSASSIGSAGSAAAASATKQNKQCQGPPAAPGTGATTGSMTDQVHANADEVSKHMAFYPIDTLSWFKSQVQNRGPWDYKQSDRGFENFGNYNYGYVGAAAGIPTGVLLRQAGAAQGRDGNAGDGGSPGNGIWGGSPPYGDQNTDQAMIKRGIQDRKNGC